MNKKQKNPHECALNTEPGREKKYFPYVLNRKISNLIKASSLYTRFMTSVISSKTETDSLSYEYQN